MRDILNLRIVYEVIRNIQLINAWFEQFKYFSNKNRIIYKLRHKHRGAQTHDHKDESLALPTKPCTILQQLAKCPICCLPSLLIDALYCRITSSFTSAFISTQQHYIVYVLYKLSVAKTPYNPSLTSNRMTCLDFQILVSHSTFHDNDFKVQSAILIMVAIMLLQLAITLQL